MAFIFWSGRNYAAAPGLDITEEGHKQAGPLKVYQLSAPSPHPCVLLPHQPKRLDDLLAHRLVRLVAASLVRAGIKEGPMWRDRMIALVIFMVINICLGRL